jgi:membrane fusion protein (multidrug efflux system)
VRKIFLACMLLLFVSSCGGDESEMETKVTVPVTVEEVRLQGIEEFVVATATVSAEKEVTLKAENEGYYRLLEDPRTGKAFALGDRVSEGTEIIHLDNPEVENDVKIESQKLNLETTKLEYQSQQSLYEKGGATLKDVKNAEKAYIDARYSYNNALITLSKLKVTAPFDGVIVSLPYHTPGVKVEAGTEIVQLLDYSKLHSEVNLPSRDMDVITPGQRVRVMNYALPDDTLMGRVTQVSPAIDPDTRSFRAAVVVENPDYILRPGMFVKAEVIVAEKDSTVVIPKDIILSKKRGKTVFVVSKGRARERIIETGLENPDRVEVTKGLEQNERLVISGFETLRDRSDVRIIR